MMLPNCAEFSRMNLFCWFSFVNLRKKDLNCCHCEEVHGNVLNNFGNQFYASIMPLVKVLPLMFEIYIAGCSTWNLFQNVSVIHCWCSPFRSSSWINKLLALTFHRLTTVDVLWAKRPAWLRDLTTTRIGIKSIMYRDLSHRVVFDLTELIQLSLDGNEYIHRGETHLHPPIVLRGMIAQSFPSQMHPIVDWTLPVLYTTPPDFVE